MFSELPSNLENFHNIIVQQTLSSIKENRFDDNFDHRRFDTNNYYKGCDKLFFPLVAARWLDWYYINHKKLYNAYQRLTDNYSKKLYLSLISYKIGGHLSVKIPVEFSKKDLVLKEIRNKIQYKQSRFDLIAKKELENIQIKNTCLEYENKKYVLDCFEGALEAYLHRKQYFFEREKNTIKPEKGDIVFDCGACQGDSSIVFANAVENNGKVFAFDPLSSHLDLIDYNIKQNPNLNIVPVPYGVSDRSLNNSPKISNIIDPGFNINTDKNTPLLKIDDFVNYESLNKVDFIKMDIEGSELLALKGAIETLKKFKPKLAISIYHGYHDFYTIINFLSLTNIYTKFFIGHYTIHNEETVLYCS